MGVEYNIDMKDITAFEHIRNLRHMMLGAAIHQNGLAAAFQQYAVGPHQVAHIYRQGGRILGKGHAVLGEKHRALLRQTWEQP